ncbi:hypothetical protein M3Y99_00638000 [Aphelenchoides fujianensis]|nr:hypothetical protein M3Y99_00638000 [Aphelenchoides fujianensis]
MRPHKNTRFPVLRYPHLSDMGDPQSNEPNEQLTWPMARHGAVQMPGGDKLTSMGSRVLSATRVDAALKNARDFVEQTADARDLQTQHTRALIQTLCDELATANRQKSGPMGASRHRLSSVALGVIKEAEPTGFGGPSRRYSTARRPTHFESMIFTDISGRFGNSSAVSRAPSTRGGSQMGDLEDGVLDDEAASGTGGADLLDIRRIYDDLDPFYIRAIPHLAMTFFTLTYLFVGAFVLQQLDDGLADRSYHNVVMFAYSLLTTIGWGGAKASSSWAQLFVVFYTLLGVPITYSTMANLGRLLSEFYTVDWIYISAVVRGTKPKIPLDEIPDRMSFRVLFNLMFVYAVVGIVLFSGVLEKYDIVQTLYFLAISVETIGLGDVEHQTTNLWDSLLCISYLTFGIVIVSAYFLSVSFYWQCFFYVHLPEHLHKLHEWLTIGRKRKISDKAENHKPIG